jgi:glycosyltransferase involved in cell wall biosynthesis
MLPELTIIAPTRNEVHNIGPFLASIPPQLSLIVVDDSDDETPRLIAKLRPHKTRVLRERYGVSAAR